MVENDPIFKKAFWEWFDNLPLKEKQKFWWFKLDMATTYFFNAIYTKQLQNKAGNSPSSPIGRGA